MSSLRLLLSLLDPPLTRSITPFVWSRGSIPTHRIIPRSRQAPFCQVTPTITTVSFLSPHTLLFVGTKSATIQRALTPISENSRIPWCANTERKEIQRKTDTEDDDVLVDIRLGRLLFLIPIPNSQRSSRFPPTDGDRCKHSPALQLTHTPITHTWHPSPTLPRWSAGSDPARRKYCNRYDRSSAAGDH